MIIQPTTRYTVSDLESDIERYRPDVVYIDGFYFMFDRGDSASWASDWEGHDGLARRAEATRP